MSHEEAREKNIERRIPFYQTVDGFRIPGMFSAEAFRSAIAYKPRPDDLFIVTYPKCGTTWVQNIVACIFKNGKPFENFLEFLTQTPFLELTGAEGAETMKRPGAIKVHLPFHLTPWSPDAKYIFIARNPKDCCVSFYHHTENIEGYKFVGGSFDDYFELFIEGQTDFGDYFDTVMSWYEHRNDPNVLFTSYEELKKDTETNVLKIAEFMGTQYKEALIKDKKLLEDVIRHSSFAYMKETLHQQMAEVQNMPTEMLQNIPDLPAGIRELMNKTDDLYKKEPSQISFVRKGFWAYLELSSSTYQGPLEWNLVHTSQSTDNSGIVGDWRNYFTPEQNKRMDQKFKERMGGTQLEELWKDIMDIKLD